MIYRKEIDGLRTVAVVPVVMFHAGLPGFAGGYVGVDVFFVISGFLITSLLLEDLQRDRFSIVHFYERRARRILPALVLVVAASTLDERGVAYLSYAEAIRTVLPQDAIVDDKLTYRDRDQWSPHGVQVFGARLAPTLRREGYADLF
ncbi:acyltransferase [Octadecabacter sp. 1_MG-2023]|uniref:acyltransferase family protein n=1 Tax=unclassified Octadecabacter TaxID=196158 RepID=UPI001C084671|nr:MULTISPECIES: acyltransferase [unclassified Octadecabacter]MBU2994074.1 acyltransferase [Octadecabacter sp. B2R22]MDO6736073.1 acyltransferase [Octadecabacter sp. 1_MG-2023]